MIVARSAVTPERSSAAEAKESLAGAMTAIGVESEQDSLVEFNDAEGRSQVGRRRYVFVDGHEFWKLLAHGVSPELVGRSHNEILSLYDKPILTDMLNLARENGRVVCTPTAG